MESLPEARPELNALAARIRHRSADAVSNFVEVGTDLLRARQLARYGEWGPFLEAVGMHERTARRWMRIAEAYKAGTFTIQQIRDQGLRDSLALLAPPKEKPDTVTGFSADEEAQETPSAPPSAAAVRSRPEAGKVAPATGEAAEGPDSYLDALRRLRAALDDLGPEGAAAWAKLFDDRQWTGLVDLAERLGLPDPDLLVVTVAPSTAKERVQCAVAMLDAAEVVLVR